MTDTLVTAALTSTTPMTRNPIMSMLACARARHARARPTEQAYTTASHRAVRAASTQARSEEHTSELQSRLHLVCRLLLEKKKNNNEQISLLPQQLSSTLPSRTPPQ